MPIRWRRHLIALLLSLPCSLALAGAEKLNDTGLSGAGGHNNVVYVSFWTSWCASCPLAFKWMNKMHQRYAAQGLQIIAINLDSERAAADGFLRRFPALFELRFDPARESTADFPVRVLPDSFLYDRSGRLLSSHQGFRPTDRLKYEAALREALAAPAAGEQSETELGLPPGKTSPASAGTGFTALLQAFALAPQRQAP
ncbi:TlpA disulfide reductase family protein [Granulosicoccaceae sp. 1_MG-2023]|nr:TlpA disulfide reductase family protein [Granulosicoccaceae sp. 1_MG-2023]